VRATKSGRVGVIREAEQRHLGKVVRDVLGVDPSDVRDHEVGRLDALRRDEVMSGEQRFQLASDEEVDPYEQDRCHAYS